MFLNKKAKVSIALIGVIGTGILAGGGVVYYSGNKSNPNAPVMEKITKGISNVADSMVDVVTFSGDSDKSINYTFDTKLDFSYNDNNKDISGGLELKDGQIVTQKDGLQQKISLGEFNVSGEEKGKKESVVFKDVNLVTDSEVGYFGFKAEGENGEKLYNSLPEKFSQVLKDGKTIKVDNSVPILKILGELSKNELMKQFAIGLATSNPLAYYKQDNTYKKLMTYLTSDELLNFVFSDGEYDETTKKTSITLNEKLCSLTPVLSNLARDLGGIPMEIKENDCKQAIAQANMMLGFITIYKEGDTKSGDYKFIIQQGSFVDLFVEYKNHKLSTWNVSLSAPQDMFSLKLNGDLDGLNKSSLKVNIEEQGISLKGEIIDGNGELVMKGDIENMLKVDGNIKVSNYIPTSYDIDGKITMPYSPEITIYAKGNLLEGKIKLNAGKEANLDFSYKGLTYNLDLDSKLLKVKSKLDKDYLDILYIENSYSGEERYKYEAKYDKGEINGTVYRYGNKEVEMSGTYKDLGEFDITISNPDPKGKQEKITLKSSDYKYILSGFESGKEILKGNLNYENTAGKLLLNGAFKFEKEKIDANFNFEHNYTKGAAKYEIPTDFEEVDTSINEMFTIPNLEGFNEMGNNTLLIGGVLGGIISVGAYDVYTKQIEKARDSTRITDIKALQIGVEQVYQDTAEYPTKENFKELVSQYLPRIPKDPKEGQYINGCEFGYKYEVGDDVNGIKNGTFKLSTCFENSNNIYSKASNDGGSYYNRYEVGINLDGVYNESFFISEIR